MRQTSVNALQVGRHGFHLLIGVALGLFMAFLYLFNFTAFF